MTKTGAKKSDFRPNDFVVYPAHGVGRRNWEKLFRLCEKDPAKAARIKDRIPRDAPAPYPCGIRRVSVD